MQAAQALMKDIFAATIGRGGPMGGIRFDEADNAFDAQPALNLLPRILCLPFETLVNICTHSLSERNKDMVVGMLADACCERLEHFITQVTISIFYVECEITSIKHLTWQVFQSDRFLTKIISY